MKKRILLYLVLFVAGLALGHLLRPDPTSMKPDVDVQTQIETALTAVLVKHNLDKNVSRPRRVAARDDGFVRSFRRVTIPVGFSTLELNHDLRRALEGSGVTVVATEKSENKSVTMHIKSAGVIVQSVVFVVREEKK